MRNKYNLSHLAHVVGHIGRLQTISVIPVVAGDSINLSIDGVFRLATTRKEIVSEVQLDICAFFVKHRHVWGQEFIDAAKLGLQALPTLSGGPAIPADSRDPFFLGIKQCGATLNKSLSFGHNFILQRYFAVPTTRGNGIRDWDDMNYYPSGVSSDAINTRLFGPCIARLPHILNGGTRVNQQNADGLTRGLSDPDWAVEVDGVGMQWDIRDLAAIQGRYKSVQEQNYFDQFYKDILDGKWGSGKINADADPRPDYLGRTTQFLSGHDVDGTDDATLGSFVGKTVGRIRFNIPRRFFPEHGNIWVMMVPRFPLVHTDEQHPLLCDAEPDVKLTLADPTVWANEKPIAFNPGRWLAGGSVYTPDVDLVQQPYGQEYRYQPNRIHPVFEAIPGYPFTSWDTPVDNEWYYYQDNEFVDVFQNSQVEQWQGHMSVNCTRFSTIPGVTASIMAGA